MIAPGWLTRSLADVPAGDGWLSARERAALAELRSPGRRSDWRLGRWTAKAALCAWSGVEPDEVEIMAAADGAPEALVGARAPAALSLSHRDGRALAIVADPRLTIGCDLEAVERRSGAFVRTWLAGAEIARVEAARPTGRARLANLFWAAKEAAAKARREGLRLDVRDAVIELEGKSSDDGDWRPLTVRWEREGITGYGWWRAEPGWVFAFVSGRPTPAPVDASPAS
jgi:4'-phosphopantetheinyl transferase